MSYEIKQEIKEQIFNAINNNDSNTLLQIYLFQDERTTLEYEHFFIQSTFKLGNLIVLKDLLQAGLRIKHNDYLILIQNCNTEMIQALLPRLNLTRYFDYCAKIDQAQMFQFGLSNREILKKNLWEDLGTSPSDFRMINIVIENDAVECLKVIFPILQTSGLGYITENLSTFYSARKYKCVTWLIDKIHLGKWFDTMINTLYGRPYMINFQQREWVNFFTNNITQIQYPNLRKKWKDFLEREEELNQVLNSIVIKDLYNIIRTYEY